MKMYAHLSAIYQAFIFENPAYKIKRPQFSKLENGILVVEGRESLGTAGQLLNKTKD